MLTSLLLNELNVYKFLALLLFLISQPVSEALPFRFIVWNVGQGEWTTLVGPSMCFHIDMGGEVSPLSHVSKLCHDRKNRAYFSHWDWDHIGFAKRAAERLRSFCILSLPGGTPSKFKKSLFQDIPRCPDLNTLIHEVTISSDFSKSKRSNDSSRVYNAYNQVIVSGDSPSSKEKIWSRRLSKIKSAILVLGHHGSKTSTSDHLLETLGPLRLAVASARRRRYGHPHTETLFKLKKFKAPVLTTEDWGSIMIELN